MKLQARNSDLPEQEAEPTYHLRVASHTIVAGNVAVVTLEALDGQKLPFWAAGAHIAVRAGDSGITREYSLCGSLQDRGSWRIAVRLSDPSRGGSMYVHRDLVVGSDVTVERLANHFEFRPSARPCFVAGGIGITPILPMIEAANRYGADWNLIYIGHSRERMPFVEELEAYGAKVQIFETSASPRPDIGELVRANGGAHIFACGPEGLLDALSSEVAASQTASLTVERFTPRKIETPEQETPFDIVVDSTGETIRVGAEQSALNALLAAGVRVPNSCGEGTCGSCETVVLEGTPDHRDSILSEEEQADGDYMYVCVSRARTPSLTLDL